MSDSPTVCALEEPPPEVGEAVAATEKWSVGTLRYTKFGLISVFIWLLWGDFCFTLMETVVPSVLPLKLQSLGASNLLVAVLISTVPSVANVLLNPVVSFRSDRHRGPRGRRIPFLLWASTPLAIFLILLGYSESIGQRLHAQLSGSLSHFSSQTMTLVLVAVFMMGFQVCNMFIASVYYYLFNDVVPKAFLGRFMSMFRVMGTAATASFSFFVFPYAQTHMKEIFLVSALLYLGAFMLMCWKVKEGSYPPPPENVGNKKGVIAAARTYLKECFTHEYYWNFFLANAFWSMGGCISPFIVYLYLSLGIELGQIGKISGYAGILSVLMLYPAGALSDRAHPLRVTLIALVGLLLVAPILLLFLFISPTPQVALGIVVTQMFVSLPIGVLYNASAQPLFMKMLPQDRYGQFASANAMVSSFAIILVGPLVGFSMDTLKWLYKGDQYYYRFAPLMTMSVQAMSLFFLYRVYRYWKRHGGAVSFVPPPAAPKAIQEWVTEEPACLV